MILTLRVPGLLRCFVTFTVMSSWLESTDSPLDIGLLGGFRISDDHLAFKNDACKHWAWQSPKLTAQTWRIQPSATHVLVGNRTPHGDAVLIYPRKNDIGIICIYAVEEVDSCIGARSRENTVFFS